jgi:hypothetical protein
MGVIGVYQPIICQWGCFIIAEMVWVHRRSRNATKHHGNIAAFIRIVGMSVWGGRRRIMEVNSTSSGPFVLGDTTINHNSHIQMACGGDTAT